MDYLKLVKDAFQITWRNKLLWIFGLFAAGGSGSVLSNGFSYQTDSSQIGKTLSSAEFNQLKSFFYQHETTILILLGLLLFLTFLCWFFSLISQGALIGSVDKITRDEKADFGSGFLIGWHSFWRIFLLGILVTLFLSLVFLVLAAPIVVLAITGLAIPALIIGIFFVLLYLVFIFLASLIITYGYRFLIIERLGVIRSLSAAYQFFHHHWREILVVYLITLVLGIGFALAVFISLLLAGGALFLMGLLLYFLSKFLLIVYGLVFGCALLIILFTIAAAFSTFISSLWTLSYLELKNKT